MDPYAELGVERTADADTIRKSYRKKAMKHHPDRKGGDVEKFKSLQKAYDILGDSGRRAEYDRNGRVEDGVQSLEVQSMQGLAQLFLSVVDAMPVESTDIVKAMRDHINANLAKNKSDMEKMKNLIAKREKALNRLSGKDGKQDDFFSQVVAADVSNRRDALRKVEEKNEVLGLMLKKLDGLKYKFDPSKVPQLIGFEVQFGN